MKHKKIVEIKAVYTTTEWDIIQLDDPQSIVGVLKSLLSNQLQEHIIVLNITGDGQVVGYSIVSMGIVNEALSHAREIFRNAILTNSTAIIMAHNHPTGTPEPSFADCEITRRMKLAGDILGIMLLDHIIISGNQYLSFQEEGIM